MAALLGAAFIVFQLVTGLLMWTLPSYVSDAQRLQILNVWLHFGSDASGLPIDSARFWLLTWLAATPYLALLWGALELWRYFGACAQGQALTQAALRHMWRFALAAFAAALVPPLNTSLGWLIVTWATPEALLPMPVRIVGDHLVAIFLSATFFGITAVLSQAVQVADENRGFV